jgi:hypothetical protein
MGSCIGQDKGTQTKEWLMLRSLKKGWEDHKHFQQNNDLDWGTFFFQQKDLEMKHKDNNKNGK